MRLLSWIEDKWFDFRYWLKTGQGPLSEEDLQRLAKMNPPPDWYWEDEQEPKEEETT